MSPPEQTMEAAEAATFKAIERLAAAVRQRTTLYNQLTKAAYHAAGGGARGARAQFDATARSQDRFLTNVARRMRAAGLGGVLDRARVR